MHSISRSLTTGILPKNERHPLSRRIYNIDKVSATKRGCLVEMIGAERSARVDGGTDDSQVHKRISPPRAARAWRTSWGIKVSSPVDGHVLRNLSLEAW